MAGERNVYARKLLGSPTFSAGDVVYPARCISSAFVDKQLANATA